MQVHRNLDSLPLFKNAVITIGTFDGVHMGHQKIISALVQQAKAVGGESVIITFDPHPRKIINLAEHLQLINTLEEKIELLEEKGIDHLVVVPFTPSFSEQHADVYIKNFLIDRFHPHIIIIGYESKVRNQIARINSKQRIEPTANSIYNHDPIVGCGP